MFTNVLLKHNYDLMYGLNMATGVLLLSDI